MCPYFPVLFENVTQCILVIVNLAFPNSFQVQLPSPQHNFVPFLKCVCIKFSLCYTYSLDCRAIHWCLDWFPSTTSLKKINSSSPSGDRCGTSRLPPHPHAGVLFSLKQDLCMLSQLLCFIVITYNLGLLQPFQSLTLQ